MSSTTDLKWSFEDLAAAETEIAPDCKGKIYRVRESSFMRANGAIVYQRSYQPLKRKSCPGCPACLWMEDYLQEIDYKVADAGYDGDIVRLVVTNVTHDWESGIVDGYDLEFAKVTK